MIRQVLPAVKSSVSSNHRGAPSSEPPVILHRRLRRFGEAERPACVGYHLAFQCGRDLTCALKQLR